MAKPLVLSLDGHDFAVSLFKVDRSDLYGEVTVEAFDEHGHPAKIMVLAADGATLIDKGGTALEMVNKAGDSIDKDDVRPTDADGDEIEPVYSSFRHTNDITEATVDDYLSLIVKSIYLLQPEEDSDLDPLLTSLGDGRIFSFPFAFRDGVQADEAFLVGTDKDAFMVVGTPAALQFLSFNQSSYLDSADEDEISADDLNFDL